MKLNPYIMFSGNAEEALNFYKECLGGEISGLQRYGQAPMPSSEEDKNKLMHGVFVFDGNLVMASDGTKDHPASQGGNIHLSVDVEDVDKLEKVFSQLGEGGKIDMPLQDTFWGARFGMLTDKFGIHWMFNHELKKH